MVEHLEVDGVACVLSSVSDGLICKLKGVFQMVELN
jgi:hypothetical protein